MGAATARLAARNGYAVSLVSLEAERASAEALVREIAEGGGAASFVSADVSSEADVVEAYKTAAGTFGPRQACCMRPGHSSATWSAT